MALNALGGLARGLAEGLQMGTQLRNQQELIDLRKKDSDRDAEIHELRKDQYASEKEIRDRRNAALREIAEYHKQVQQGGNVPAAATTPSIQDPNAPSFGAPPQQQTPSAINMPGPGLAMSAPAVPFAADNPAGVLAPAPQAQQAPEIPPAKVLERGMVTGMYSPKALTDIANIFAKHGLQDEGIKYMNTAYEAKKRGAVDAGMAFMQNNPGAAAEALQAGGIELEGLPVKVKPDDPNDMNWKIAIKGQGEKTINVREWMGSTMNYDEFLKAEDRRKKDERDAAMDERKQSFVEHKGRAELGLEAQKTKAQIGFLNSRSEQALANADKADRWEPGSLRPSRSSEAQINTAIKRRDTSFDRISSIKNEDTGKFEVDPMRRQVLDSAANQYQAFIEDQQGEELDARQHHKFTDAMLSYPVGGTPEQVEQWQRKELMPRMGFKSRAKATEGSLARSSGSEQGNIDLNNRPVVKNSDGSISTVKSMSFNEDGKEVLIPTIREDGKVMSEDEAIAHYRKTGKHLGKFSTPEEATTFAKQLSANQGARHGIGGETGPKPGSLAWMKQKADERAAITQEMEGVQKALQNPNLNVQQKQALALKAQEIAARRDSLK